MKSELSEAARTPMGDPELEPQSRTRITSFSESNLRVARRTERQRPRLLRPTAVALNTKARAAFEGQSSEHRQKLLLCWRKV